MEQANFIPLDPGSHVPLYLQLRDRLKEMIATGNLRSGDRLEPTRSFARDLGVHRTTVEAAYAELESEGLLVGHVGRGTFVAGQMPRRALAAPAATASALPDSFPWQGFFPYTQSSAMADDPLEALMRAAGEQGAISFATAHPPVDVLPLDDFRRACDRVLRRHGRDVLKPGPAAGYPPLLDMLAQRLHAPAGEITITNGCQQSLDLLAKVFVSPGQLVMMENPVYPGALLPFRQAGARIIALPPLEVLPSVLESQRVRLIAVTPNFQNPTGAVMPLESRHKLLEIARHFQTPIVENDSYGMLAFSGKTSPSLKSLDNSAGVIYIGSLSKAGFPGLRLGWCVAPPEVTTRLRRAKQASDLHTDQFVQAVICEFGPRLDRAIAAVRATCRANAATLEREVARHFPAEVAWQPPQGGMSVWFRLPSGIAADAVLARAREHRVIFTPGRFFYFQDAKPETFRLTFGALTRNEIARGVKVLGEAIRAEMRHSSNRAQHKKQRVESGWALV